MTQNEVKSRGKRERIETKNEQKRKRKQKKKQNLKSHKGDKVK